MPSRAMSEDESKAQDVTNDLAEAETEGQQPHLEPTGQQQE